MEGRSSALDAPEGVLDALVPPDLRARIEERYWRPVERASHAGRLVDDPEFLERPDRHPVFFSDHGVVHVRDVAAGVVTLVRTVSGVLLPGRSADRRHGLEQLAVLLVYLHDIGMVEPTSARRRVHPQWAAQLVFAPGFADLLAEIAELAPLRSRLDEVAMALGGWIGPDLLAAEVLATTMGHSKSLVPAPLLDDRPALRALVSHAVLTDLDDQSVRGRDADRPSAVAGRYASERAFAWMVHPHPACRSLTDDVVDALRAVRAADALRQRGAVQRTSAGYEVFLDSETGRALFAVRADDAPVRYVGLASPISAGEAAIRATTVTAAGDLRVWFHAERLDGQVAERTADHVAGVVIDVADDVLPSFARATSGEGLAPRRRDGDMAIELVGHQGGLGFAELVAGAVRARRPDLGARLRVGGRVLPDPAPDPQESARVAEAEPVDAGTAAWLLDRLRAVPGVRGDLDEAELRAVRVATVRRGDDLVRPGFAATVAYVPMGPGLVVEPVGGYPAAPAPAWEVVGITGVMRAGGRNARVWADQEVAVLVVPAERFRTRWFRPLDAAELVAELREGMTTTC